MLHRHIKAPLTLVGRGIPEKHATCGTRHKFVGSCAIKVRVTQTAKHMKVGVLR